MHYVNQQLSRVSYYGIEIAGGARRGGRARPTVIWVTYAPRPCVGAIFAADGGVENWRKSAELVDSTSALNEYPSAPIGHHFVTQAT
jgi:hypothetical protein